jgi:hypothetical protein
VGAPARILVSTAMAAHQELILRRASRRPAYGRGRKKAVDGSTAGDLSGQKGEKIVDEHDPDCLKRTPFSFFFFPCEENDVIYLRRGPALRGWAHGFGPWRVYFTFFLSPFSFLVYGVVGRKSYTSPACVPTGWPPGSQPMTPYFCHSAFVEVPEPSDSGSFGFPGSSRFSGFRFSFAVSFSFFCFLLFLNVYFNILKYVQNYFWTNFYF